MAPCAIVVMGVSGSGKTTVASLLAAQLGWTFADGDAFHPARNVGKMEKGIALTDADRWPWLDAIARWMLECHGQGRGCVVACSALKRAYRERLSRAPGQVRFVYLKAEYALVAARMAARTGHYMPVTLLQSQYDALEEPGPDERALAIGVEHAPDRIVAFITAQWAGLR